ncbi:hypothetical protein JCM10213v2_004798 [Rhodosporidiobolus nylandii]
MSTTASALPREYPKQRYDAEFDRSLAGGHERGGRELFNPNAPSSSSSPAYPSPPPIPPSRSAEERPRRERSRTRDRDLDPSSSRSRSQQAQQQQPQRSVRERIDPSALGSSRASPAVAAGADSKDSLESVETDFSGRTAKSSNGGRRRRREKEGDEAGEGQEGKGRMLFDPRRDDPMRFAGTPGPAAGKGKADARKVAGQSMMSIATTASGFSDAPDPAGGADDAASLFTTSTTASSAAQQKKQHPAVSELKRVYREIQELEQRVQDEAKAAQREREREEGNGGVRLAGGRTKADDEYWVRVAAWHKQLADAHYTFLTLALDPSHPAALHQLPQRYNIPQRLWQVAFHSLLERMRHTVLTSPHPSQEGEANVLEHLIEFIQFAYGHYTQLFEDPKVATFRAAWIEQLGDLARYRMAVAGLASRVHAAAAAATSSSSLTASALAAAEKERSSRPRPADAASIGVTALDDWDLEEHETWKEMAREWYALGVAEQPGAGRLQHHLALLSKGEEMRSLYHYVKSLTAAHPYLSARESILPLFEDEHQARRTQPDVAKPDLFVHLHGMLFTKIALDDFDDVLERFLERLKEEGWALGRANGSDEAVREMETGAAAPFGDREWFMLGVINIAALLQYGAEDGVLRKLMEDEAGSSSHHHGGGGGGKHGHHGSGRGHHHSSRHGAHHHGHHASTPRAAPQAIMLKRAEGEDDVADGDETERASGADGRGEDVLKPLSSGAASTSPADDPLPFKLAQRLAFSLLSFALSASNSFRRVGGATVLNPYITLLLTFLSHLSSHPAAFAHVERAVPWEELCALLNSLPVTVEVRVHDAPNKIVGGRPLPEDWCIRGMDWAGRTLFGRGYWREAHSRAKQGGEFAPPPIEGVDAAPLRVESESDALKFDLSALAAASATPSGDEGEQGPNAAAQLATSRWRRLALCAAWMVRNIPGLDYDGRAANPAQRFRIGQPLSGKIQRWREEDELEREQERLARLTLAERRGKVEEELEFEEELSEDEDDEDDSEAVRELKTRRRALKAVIRSAQARRAAPGAGLAAKLGGKAATVPKVFAGFTVLVFDTNILLTSIALFRELVEAECWTIVVPLAVITELDGLKRNSTALGAAAVQVIDYLESAIRTHARHLKIQTSRNNYLKDLAIRNESIDFAPLHPAAGLASPVSAAADLLTGSSSADEDDARAAAPSADQARTMDDVILRAVAWQQQHFTSRLALVNPRAVREGKKPGPDTAKVVLVTFDRNLRLKARARALEAVDEKGLKRALEVALVSGAG